ncbi:hypothetical protein [Pseudochryseolinea flava]|uniref:Uncharacterized protein n=1 Tax=Pseudochryseolinea flava TaxID=2059302 RepID=A0A364XY89_9BACT|nr:hypothetical protein [Pseudochryseolinea flava]RAV99454.1 hypothetical protein DQQ10_19760 [Pseudochryseolinea flava]
MDSNVKDIDLSDVNNKFSIATFEKLKPGQKVTFRNQLKEAIAKLKKDFTIDMMDDDYLFKQAGLKANFTVMQMMTELKELSFRKKTSAIQHDAAQQEALTKMQIDLRKQLTKALFDSDGIFNRINERTIAVDQNLFQRIVG